MRILFVESDHRFMFGLPLGFRDAGHNIRVTGSISPDKLIKIFAEFVPNIVIVIGWNAEHTDINIKEVNTLAVKYNSILIYWATEDPTFIHDYSIPLIKKLKPNYVFTVSKSSLKKYKDLGINASFLPFGFQPSLHKQMKYKHERYNISMIANGYPNVMYHYPNHYRKKSIKTLVKPLLENKVSINIWGKRWNETLDLLSLSSEYIKLHDSIHYLKTNTIYACSDIIIGLQNHDQDVIAMRTFEILGSGGFLITTYHSDLTEYFTADKDLVLVSSPEEMIDKYNFYINNKSLMDAIRQKAKKTSLDHTYKNRATSIIKYLKEARWLY